MKPKTPIRNKEDFLVFASPFIGEQELDEVLKTLRSGWLGSGPKVSEFESAFKKYKNADHAVALNSCTAALHLSMLVAGISPGDEVITTPLTFCATVNAILHAGGVPVLADIDYRTMNIDPVEIRKKISKRTKALVPVHFAGLPCDMTSIMEIATEYNLKVIEDCAHAIESEYQGKKVGTIGDFGCFSFYVTKNIVTGEGGMVLARKAEDVSRLKILGLHGMSKDAWNRFGNDGFRHYQVVECGFKYNMMDLQAAIGIHQLERVGSCWQRREEIWERYMLELSDLPLELPIIPGKDIKHGYHLFTVQIDQAKCGMQRDEFINAMSAHNIGVGVHYLSIPEHQLYKERFGWKPEDYPNATKVGRSTVSIPITAKLSDRDVDDVVAAVRAVLS
ncbi:MAG: DegT/DnrJ/EryC1/StrS family aminotransferase [Paracoccaceae bacterium]